MGICHNGRILKEAVAEKSRLFRETGHCYGLGSLDLHRDDPGKMTLLSSRLVAGALAARERAKLVAASPAIRTFGENLFVITTPEGDAVAASMGLIGHLGGVRQMIKSMANLDFEENPEINDGDIFGCNDPVYGAPHPADVYTLVPVFHKGELVAWTVGLNHVAEIGGVLSGGGNVRCPNMLWAGFVFPPTKIGQKFELAKWWDLYWQRRTRLPNINMLDERMRTAGALILRDRVLEIIQEFGVDFFRQGLREIVERERLVLEQRIVNMTVPGIYNNTMFYGIYQKGWATQVAPEADTDYILHHPMELHITSKGRLVCNFEGASKEGFHGANVFEGGIWNGLSWWWFPLLSYTVNVGAGHEYQLEFVRPEGTWVNPQNPWAASTLGMRHVCQLASMGIELTSLAFFARGVLEEAVMPTGSAPFGNYVGAFADGTPWAFMCFETCGGLSQGARPFMDGMFDSANIVNPESDHGEYEEWEPFQPPLVMLSRYDAAPNFSAPGRFRGGQGQQLIFVAVEPGIFLKQNFAVATDCNFGHLAVGASGGYPFPGFPLVVFSDTNMRELMRNGEYPRTYAEVTEWISQGKLKVGNIETFCSDGPDRLMKDGDFLMVGGITGMGWGDPLDRDPRLAEQDVTEGWVTHEVATGVYGVAGHWVGANWRADVEETARTRETMRQQRREKARPAKQWWQEERKMVTDRRLPVEILEVYRDIFKSGKPLSKFVDTWQLAPDFEL